MNQYAPEAVIVDNDSNLSQWFAQFRPHVVGLDKTFMGPYGEKKIVYADWIASGRLYGPIEEKLVYDFGPFVANTHTETSTTGKTMTYAYHRAQQIIKAHVNASKDDVLISAYSGMTGVINKFQRILNLRLPENFRDVVNIPEADKPVVFITHMEHHSNQTSWLETIADVEIIQPDANGDVDLNNLLALLEKYEHRRRKIASVTAASNVTGVKAPYHEIAKIMHEHDGLCFVDFACAAPYVTIDMHPAHDPEAYLDAVFFSPHKFLGGPGATGILIFNKHLYNNRVPDNPGGGTVNWTNPWGEHSYIADIEVREDGGTPPFLQTIKAALAIQLKEQMGMDKIAKREHYILKKAWDYMSQIPNLHIVDTKHPERLSVLSFYIEECHFNLAVRLLNDHFGVQVRGGCLCAGTYGHYLFEIDPVASKSMFDRVDHGDLTAKPGYVRLSLHPVMSEDELQFILESIRYVAENFRTLAQDYTYNRKTNEYQHNTFGDPELAIVERWFS
jgi:selenocysteine lyase/cysteine desulfurase